MNIVQATLFCAFLHLSLSEEIRLINLDPPEAQQYIDRQDTSLKYAPKIDSNVPAVRFLGNEPHNVNEDIYLANQYHGQDGIGGYLYGYAVPDIAKTERKKAGGDLRGAYNYIAGNGQEIKVEYWDDGTGFHQIDNVPKVLPKQIEDTPEVAAAKAEHARIWQEQAERNSRPIENPYDSHANYFPQGQAQNQLLINQYQQQKQQYPNPGQSVHYQGSQNPAGYGGQYQASQSSSQYARAPSPGFGGSQSGGQFGASQGSTGITGGQSGSGGQYGAGQPSGVQQGSSHSSGGQFGSGLPSGGGQYGGSQSSENKFGASQGSGGQFGAGPSSGGQYGSGPSSKGPGSAQFLEQTSSHSSSISGGFGTSGSPQGGSQIGGGQSSGLGGGQSSSSGQYGSTGIGSPQSPSGQYGDKQVSGSSQFAAGQGYGKEAGISGGQYGGNQASGGSQFATGQGYGKGAGISSGQYGGNQASGSSQFAAGQGYGKEAGISGGQYGGATQGPGSGQYRETQSFKAGYSYGGQGSASNQYSQSAYGRNEGEYNEQDNQEEQGPPKGFFYSFDYPVGIIVSKGGPANLKDIYNQNKNNFEKQLQEGHLPGSKSSTGYIAS